MRIAFDLDDTIIPAPGSPMAAEPIGRVARLISSEPLRKGAPSLMKLLWREGHEVWLYTTSLRSPFKLRLWFASFGVALDGVVNQATHDAAMAKIPDRRFICSKYPPAFGIDLLIDDSEGVRLEGERLGFSVLTISENDSDWCARIRDTCKRLSSRRESSQAPRDA